MMNIPCRSGRRLRALVDLFRPAQRLGKSRREMSSLYLARRTPWDVRYDQEPLRYLEGTQAFRCKSAYLVRGAWPMLQHYRSSDIFAEQRMRDWECSGVLDVGVAAKHLVNLQRRNLFASTVDDFIKAPGKKEISIVVEISLIPGSIPFAKERARVFV